MEILSSIDSIFINQTICFQGKIGASEIANDRIEFRSSYAFVGFTGPLQARQRMDWIREENSKAGDGPSIISITIKTGEILK